MSELSTDVVKYFRLMSQEKLLVRQLDYPALIVINILPGSVF
jgi:hypothetical protein